MTDPCALIDHYTDLFRELRAALPPAQAEAVEAVLCGPFYDGPHKISGAGAPKPPKPRKPPTLAAVAKQANKAAIAVARYEVKPDGTVVVITGEPEPGALENPWFADLDKAKQQ